MLPGVPREMRGLFADELKSRISERSSHDGAYTVIRSRTLRTTGIAESALADQLGPLSREVDGLGVAFLPGVEGVDLRLTARDVPPSEADAVLESGIVKLREATGRYVYGEGDADLAAREGEHARTAGVVRAVSPR